MRCEIVYLDSGDHTKILKISRAAGGELVDSIVKSQDVTVFLPYIGTVPCAFLATVITW